MQRDREAPVAESGHLCVFLRDETNVSTEFERRPVTYSVENGGLEAAGKTGALLLAQPEAAGSVTVTGVWAVTS